MRQPEPADSNNDASTYDRQLHPIKVAVRKTGLNSHVIRGWERRYGAVTPLRTPTNRRLYTDEDIERLIALRRLTQAGRSIGQIARLPTAQLQTLIQGDDEPLKASANTRPAATSPESYAFHIHSCLDAVERLDADALERALTQAVVAFGQPVVIERIIAPLMQQIGELWHAGVYRMTHEHLASAVVRHVLWDMSESYEILPHAPQLIVTTPVGQLHEIGALMAASTARREGWRVLYLGANLPAEEIASTVQPGVKAVALSMSYPLDDPHLPLELKKLRQCLPADIRILAGGRAAPAYADVLASIHAITAITLTEFSIQLEALRSSGAEPHGVGPCAAPLRGRGEASGLYAQTGRNGVAGALGAAPG